MAEGLDDFVETAAGLIESNDGGIKVSGMAEAGIAVAIIAIGAGIYKFLRNSSVKADKLPDININAAKKS